MTAPRDCKHLHGANVPHLGSWVCGQCFRLLGERPKKLGMRPWGKGAETRQEVVWLADERKSAQGTTLADFLRTMAKRYQRRTVGGMDDSTAYRAALNYLQALGDEFGDLAYDWSHAAARDMADDDMHDWEQVGSGGNE